MIPLRIRHMANGITYVKVTASTESPIAAGRGKKLYILVRHATGPPDTRRYLYLFTRAGRRRLSTQNQTTGWRQRRRVRCTAAGSATSVRYRRISCASLVMFLHFS